MYVSSVREGCPEETRPSHTSDQLESLEVLLTPELFSKAAQGILMRVG